MASLREAGSVALNAAVFPRSGRCAPAAPPDDGSSLAGS